MSLVELRVELPSYQHSFTVHVEQTWTILQVKTSISQTCIGNPNVKGQRIIWRGRCLEDTERVEDIWKSADEPRIAHLSVHPSAWTSSPPQVPGASVAPSSLFAPQSSTPVQAQQYLSPIPPVSGPNPIRSPTGPRLEPPILPQVPHNHALQYIVLKHNIALTVLTTGRVPVAHDRLAVEAARQVAITTLARYGYWWPVTLDEDYPPYDEGEETSDCLQYEKANIDGAMYLTLMNPGSKPSRSQAHALRVLSFTFALLSIPAPPTVTAPATPSHHQIAIPAAQVNQLLQQLGLPQLRIQVQGQHRPLRNLLPLLIPVMALLVRILILFYFFSPTQTPVIALVAVGWVVYELGWGHLHHVVTALMGQPANRPAAHGAGAHPQPQANGGAVIPALNGHAAGPGPRGPLQQLGLNQRQTQINGQFDNAINAVATTNLAVEEAALAALPGTSHPEPGFGHKALTFFNLLVVTFHPAVWNRRRTALRQREGRVRLEANAREREETTSDGAEDAAGVERRAQIRAELVAQHARRPLWVQNYIERARGGDWVDDA